MTDMLNKRWIILCLVIWLLFIGGISPMTQMRLNDVNIAGTGSVAIHNTDDKSLEGKYYESIVITEETEEVVFHDYPIRSLDNISLFISIDNGVLSFRNLKIQLFGLPIETISKETINNKSVDNNVVEINQSSDVVTIKTESGQALVELDMGLLFCIKPFFLYFAMLLLLSILITVAIRFFLLKINACWIIESCGVHLIALMDIMAVVILGEVLLKGWGFWNFGIFLLNVIIVGSITFALIAILGWQVGQIISSFFFASIYLIDYYVIKFKGMPIVPWDIKAIKTAMAVSGEYSFVPEAGTVLFSCGIIVLVIVSAILIKKQDYRRFSIRRRAITLVGSLLIGILVVNSPVLNLIPANAWGKDITYCYKEYGTISSFANYYKKNRVQRPAGYSKKNVGELIKRYSTNDIDQSIQDNDYPDKIIMIMNESFAELDQFSDSISINDTPFFKKLSKEALTGNLCVSVRGGGTCNTEFEALTGFAMIFLPGASYPFVSYMDDKEVFSLAKFFRSKDYSTASLHLAEGSNWSRDKAYKSMGLEPFYTKDDYKNIRMLRGFATDKFDYEKLIEIEKNMQGKKKFLFNVTIQNHGGYDNPEGLNLLEDLSGLDDYITAQVYFSLIKESDNALKELVEYYREDKEKTMIVFFGDHQPALESEVEQKLEINQDHLLDPYITPFLIWKNYDNDMKKLGTVSANYLPLIIMKEANYPLTPFMRIVDEAYRSFPVLTTQGIIDSKGDYYRNISDIPYSKEELDNYMIAQYEELFGNSSFSKAVH